jgi:hypothetical protein
VLSLFSAPSAILFELDFFSNEFLVFAGPVIYPFAGSAGKFYKSILGHKLILIQHREKIKLDFFD